VDGIRFDMTFWPVVCYCAHCQARFKDETGQNLPRTIDWSNPDWLSFQHKREEWLVDFAQLATRTVKRLRPEVSVEHQSSTFLLDWQLGVTDKLAECCDFLQGDFYGDQLQGSIARKLLYNLTPNQPFGFETSVVAGSLDNHTGIKSRELMSAKAHAAVSGGGAMVFIDGIDPVGTLNPSVYERIGSVFAETMRYDECQGGALCQDVAVYASLISKFDPADNGKPPNDATLSRRSPHVDGVVNACRALISAHIPFGVITRHNLAQLGNHKILVLPNVLLMDAEEAGALREFVGMGGCLYASKYTSLVTPDGRRQPDFQLADLFGASYRGEVAEQVTFVAPTDGAQGALGPFSAKYPLGLSGSQLRLAVRPETQVLGSLVLPYTDPRDIDRFASIHSNPPGIATGEPAVVMHRFGKGQVIYAAGEVESALTPGLLAGLLNLFGVPFSLEAEAPACVEVTLFDDQQRGRYVINLLNFQRELPNIPIDGIRLRLRLAGRRPGRLSLLPDGEDLGYVREGNVVELDAPRLDTFLMLALSYDEE
jgi:hypothetical protein